jgi:hypothetical protein
MVSLGHQPPIFYIVSRYFVTAGSWFKVFDARDCTAHTVQGL